MTPERMHETGEKSRQMQWTDQELDDQIAALERVTEYLKGRGDAQLVLSPLLIELNSFRTFKSNRKGWVK